MATESFGSIVIDMPAGVLAERLSRGVGVGVGVAGDQGAGVLLADGEAAGVLSVALREAGLQPSEAFSLRRGGDAALGASDGATPESVVRVRVRPNESAVVLVEGADGVFAWALPRNRVPGSATGAADDEASDLIFLIGGTPAGSALSWDDLSGTPVLDWLAKRVIGGLKAQVMRFVVDKIEDLAVDRIERDLKPGLVQIRGKDPAKWIHTDDAPVIRSGAEASGSVLLLVHGTFSTTQGSYQDLTKSERTFLDEAYQRYDAVLGFDHKTLAESPVQNARAMMDALNPHLAQGVTVDAVAYSRGGLVFRQWAEILAREERSDLKLRKAVFVGCTNNGTNLAEPEHWRTMIDLYTNVAIAAARAATSLSGNVQFAPPLVLTLRLLGEFVKTFSTVAITLDNVPGLAAMRPTSPLVKALNLTPEVTDQPLYYAITSNFDPSLDPGKGVTKELVQFVLDRVTNRLFGGDNDLVVDTASMTHFGLHGGRLDTEQRLLKFGNVGNVYHTNYFGAEETDQKLSEWLLQ